MFRKGIAFVLCAILMVAGWVVWDTYFRPSGADKFDEAFLREFDSEYIVNSIDELRKTGFFEYQDNTESMEYHPQRLIRWPIGSRLLISPFCISIEENSERYHNSGIGYDVVWSTVKSFSRLGEVSEELKSYKYIYRICFVAPSGQIHYTQAGNSRKECMDTAQENLRWIMSLLD